MFKKGKYDLDKFQNCNNNNCNDIFRSISGDDISISKSNSFSNVYSKEKSRNKVKRIVDIVFHKDRMKDLEKELNNAVLRKEYAQKMLDKEIEKSKYLTNKELIRNTSDRINEFKEDIEYCSTRINDLKNQLN